MRRARARSSSPAYLSPVVISPALLGLGGDQSTLRTGSKAASDIAGLWWIMLVGSVVVFGVVLTLLVVGVLRRRAGDEGRWSRLGTPFVAVAGVLVPTAALVILFALTLATIPTTSATGSTKPGSSRLVVDVTGRQWFWDVDYPNQGVRTANEIHIPVGEPVSIRATTKDVVHSLWVPGLNRKIDMIPGRTNVLRFQATRPGSFRGQCAEFCGLQHAHMGLWVIAEPRAKFRQWLAAEKMPAPQPATASEERGQQVFLGSSCVYCHRIAGTNASGTVGPDLSHLASRRALGAATIPNSRGYLAGWILDPQHLKPGIAMPGTALSGEELQALLDYLESLR